MSGKGFHVHGPHDHEVEHQAHAEPQGMAGRLVVFTSRDCPICGSPTWSRGPPSSCT